MKIEELKLKPEIQRAVKLLNFDDATLIQEKCIPLLQQGKDVVAQSNTGSGKTAAFGLPMLEKLDGGKGVQAIILTPTRELCVQVSDAIKSFSKFMPLRVATLYGGVGLEPQVESIKKSEIVVGTPGRTLDHIRRNSLKLNNVKYVVLDEADKMLEMGFIEDVEKILSFTPKQKQMALFSATMPARIYELVQKYQNNPIKIKGDIHVDKSKLRQIFYNIRPNEKFSLLVHLLKQNTNSISLVFCGTRREADVVTKNLKNNGIKAMSIHGGLTQSKRLNALEMFKKEKVTVLVATDVAARGLDIRNVTHVYNYDVPKSSEDYIHRIGRTARAGEDGDAITLLCERDYENFDRVLSDRSIQIEKIEPPKTDRANFIRGGLESENRFSNKYMGQRRNFKGSNSRAKRGNQRR